MCFPYYNKSWRKVSDTSRQLTIPPDSSMCRGADQPTDNGPYRGSAERDPSSVTAVMMDVVNDMMPRRRRRAMRTMSPPMTRRSNRRTRRQYHASHKNRECLDDLVHITPAFPGFCPYREQGDFPYNS